MQLRVPSKVTKNINKNNVNQNQLLSVKTPNFKQSTASSSRSDDINEQPSQYSNQEKNNHSFFKHQQFVKTVNNFDNILKEKQKSNKTDEIEKESIASSTLEGKY